MNKEQLIADIKESKENWDWIKDMEKKYKCSPHYNWIPDNLESEMVKKEIAGKDISDLKEQHIKYHNIIKRSNEFNKKYNGINSRLTTRNMEWKLAKVLVNE